VADTGQEFVNTRGADSNAEPLEFDSGMGILPEAIDMTGEHDDCNKRLCEHAYNMNTQKLSRMFSGFGDASWCQTLCHHLQQ